MKTISISKWVKATKNLTMKANFLPKMMKCVAVMVLLTGATNLLADVTLNVGTLPVGKSVRIKFQQTVNANANGSITNQGTVTATGGISVQTDDPTVTGSANPTVTVVSIPPVVGNTSKSVAEDATLTFSFADFNNAYSDANGDTMTNIQIVALPANGTLNLDGTNVVLNQVIPTNSLGSLTFVGSTNFNGSTTCNWKGMDSMGLLSDNPATMTITVTEVNDPPTATNDVLSNIAEDSGVRTISFASLLANDSAGPANESGQTLTTISATNSVGGTVSLSGANVLFTPTNNYNGAASFTYTVQDNGTTAGAPDPKTATVGVSFTITEVNDPPVAANDSLTSIAEDSGARTISIASLLANDSVGPANESSQTLTLISVNTPVGGTVNISGTNLIFNPTTNFNGSASFNYVAQDNGTTAGAADPKTSTGTVSFNVTEVADYDFGDAPSSYGTLLASDGARHLVPYGGATLYLGSTGPDLEYDAFAGSGATGDSNGVNDEDGVVLPTTFVSGSASNITVTANATGILNAWIDFNRDGDFNDPGEQIRTNATLSAGPNVLSISVGTVSAGSSYARFRFSSQSGLLPTGAASDGEVEDYAVTLAPNPLQNKISITRQPTSWLLRFVGSSGSQYYFQSAPDPAGTWTNLSGLLTAPADGSIQFVDSNSPPAVMRFYRTKTGP